MRNVGGLDLEHDRVADAPRCGKGLLAAQGKLPARHRNAIVSEQPLRGVLAHISSCFGHRGTRCLNGKLERDLIARRGVAPQRLGVA